MRLLREPLVHFLLIGIALFGLYAVVGPEDGRGEQNIVVTAGDIERMKVAWRLQWGRLPRAAELDGLIRDHIREEVLYREALALGLDREDTIVRRRLVQKIEFLSQDLAVDEQPSVETLGEFFQAQSERYAIPPRLSFSHVYFSRDKRGDSAVDDAEDLLAELRRSGRSSDLRALGDRFMLEHDYVEKSEAEIGQLFGRAFAPAVMKLDVGDWQGPVESAYGVHLILPREKTAPRQPQLSQVERRVRSDYLAARRAEANEAFYASLRERYDVEIDGQGGAGEDSDE